MGVEEDLANYAISKVKKTKGGAIASKYINDPTVRAAGRKGVQLAKDIKAAGGIKKYSKTPQGKNLKKKVGQALKSGAAAGAREFIDRV